MKRGLAFEGTAAQKYADELGVDIHDVGFVTYPSACHLGCSPDRRLYEPEVSTISLDG